jgi:hypothetical protein
MSICPRYHNVFEKSISNEETPYSSSLYLRKQYLQNEIIGTVGSGGKTYKYKSSKTLSPKTM